MEETIYVCEECGQTAFQEMVEYNGKKMCSDCINKIDADILVCYFTEDEEGVFYLPLKENLEKGYYKENPPKEDGSWNGRAWKEYDTAYELIKHWGEIEWGYSKYNKLVARLSTLVAEELVLKDPTDVVEDWEFELVGFRELMYDAEMYNTPWDAAPNPNSLFVSYYSERCMMGHEYSKDFAYFDCPDCGRIICEQNPANGWRVQYKIVNECEQVCVQCWQKEMLTNGIDFENWNEETIDGDFFSYDELKEAGFVEYSGSNMVGSGHVGYNDPDKFINRLKELHEEHPDWKILCNYGSMAIGGLGGYVDIYVKIPETVEEV